MWLCHSSQRESERYPEQRTLNGEILKVGWFHRNNFSYLREVGTQSKWRVKWSSDRWEWESWKENREREEMNIGSRKSHTERHKSLRLPWLQGYSLRLNRRKQNMKFSLIKSELPWWSNNSSHTETKAFQTSERCAKIHLKINWLIKTTWNNMMLKF